MSDVAWEKVASNVIFMLLMSFGAAWVLGVLGVSHPFLERVGASFLSFWFIIYTVSEGTEIGFARCMTGHHERYHGEEMPEAEQALNE